MTLLEILDQFMTGTPIQRKDTWGRCVYIKTNGKRIGLYRKKPEGGKSLIETFDGFDRYFSLDDIQANDWQIIEE